jgi:hypothetical protein
MSKPMYATIDELDDAINEEREHREDLTMYLDGGEVIIRSSKREADVFRGYEQACLIEFFVTFMGIKHEEV